MLEFTPDNPPKDNPIPNSQEVPKEFDIFFKTEQDFLPPGKTFADLTPEELKILQSQYRFSYFRPGLPQCISGFKNSC
jgi:hypothetical protein